MKDDEEDEIRIENEEDEYFENGHVYFGFDNRTMSIKIVSKEDAAVMVVERVTNNVVDVVPRGFNLSNFHEAVQAPIFTWILVGTILLVCTIVTLVWFLKMTSPTALPSSSSNSIQNNLLRREP